MGEITKLFTFEKIMAFGAAVYAVYTKVKAAWIKIEPIVTPLIVEAEKMFQDGKLDRAERKQLVLDGVKIWQEQYNVKLGFMERWFLGIIIDKIAQRLPDIVLPPQGSAKAVMTLALSQKGPSDGK